MDPVMDLQVSDIGESNSSPHDDCYQRLVVSSDYTISLRKGLFPF